MLEAIFSWGVLGFIIALLIGAGFAVLSMTPPRYRIAEVCFCVAALIFLGKFFYWAVTSQSGLKERLLVGFGVCGLTGSLLIWGLAWIEAMLPKSSQPTVSALSDRPSFAPVIHQMWTAHAGEHNQDAAIGLIGTIRNLGSPGTVDNFLLTVKVDDRELKAEFPVALTPEQTLTVHGKPQTFTLSGATQWVRTAREHPIEKNSGVDGWIVGVVRGVTSTELVEKRATVILTCLDVTGQSFSAERSFTGQLGTLFAIGDVQQPQPTAGPLALSEQQSAIVQRLIERYKKKHKSAPTEEWINSRLASQGQSFRVQFVPQPKAAITFEDSEFTSSGGGFKIQGKDNYQINLKGSKIMSVGTGIENTNPNAKLNIENSTITSQEKGITNSPNPMNTAKKGTKSKSQ